jgi:hypothetical protein
MQSLGQDVNPVPLEQEVGMLTSRLRCSVELCKAGVVSAFNN